MTIWALIVALLIGKSSYVAGQAIRADIDFPFFAVALVYVVPIGMIQAVTNRQVGLKWVALTVLECSRLSTEGDPFQVS